MHSLYKAVFTVALSAAVLCPMAHAQNGDAGQSGPYDRARTLIGRVQQDLDRAQKMAPVAGKQQERYENAHRHLSQFDDKLSQGEFDKGKLDDAIDDVGSVLKNNVVSSQSRAKLRDDLDDLRAMRTARGKI
ncbi:MAG: hypothetical protein ABSH46_08725 [Bryobacteraceae bacterium]|jgi:hypothetical protein